jgi:hypothetical protein
VPGPEPLDRLLGGAVVAALRQPPTTGFGLKRPLIEQLGLVLLLGATGETPLPAPCPGDRFGSANPSTDPEDHRARPAGAARRPVVAAGGRG